MAGEIIYADLDIGPGKHCRKRPSPPQPGGKYAVGFGGAFFFSLFFFGLLMCLGDSRPFVVQGGEGARGCWGAIKDPIRFFLGIPWVVSLRDGCGVALKPRGPTAARRTAIPPAVENQAGSRSLPWG